MTANTGTSIPIRRRTTALTRTLSQLAGLLFRCLAADRIAIPLSP
jgi:hypothetical protein